MRYHKKYGQCIIKKSTKPITYIAKQKLKLFEGKLDFLSLFENWSFRGYLKIGFLKIKCKNEFFLEVKFERDWNLESYLRVRDLSYENWDLRN